MCAIAECYYYYDYCNVRRERVCLARIIAVLVVLNRVLCARRAAPSPLPLRHALFLFAFCRSSSSARSSSFIFPLFAIHSLLLRLRRFSSSFCLAFNNCAVRSVAYRNARSCLCYCSCCGRRCCRWYDAPLLQYFSYSNSWLKAHRFFFPFSRSFPSFPRRSLPLFTFSEQIHFATDADA